MASNAPPPSRSGSLFSGFLVVACLALAVLVVLLAMQNRRLKAEISALGAHGLAGIDPLEEGERLEPFGVLDAEGNPSTMLFDGGRTLLLLFSADCPACQDTFPIWDEVFSGAPPSGLRVVGVHFGAEPPFSAEDLARPYVVYAPADIAQLPAERLVTPTALLLDDGGRIERVWYGVPSPEAELELRAVVGS